MRILVFLFAITLIACTSDSDSSGGIVPQFVYGGVDAVILPAYGFEVSSTSAGDPLTVRVPNDGTNLGISVDFANTLQGEIELMLDGNDYLSVEKYAVKALSSFTVDSDVGDAAFLGVFDVEVIDDLVYMPNVPHHPPNWGFYRVITPGETVNVQVIPGPFSSVEISVGAGGSIWLS